MKLEKILLLTGALALASPQYTDAAVTEIYTRTDGTIISLNDNEFKASLHPVYKCGKCSKNHPDKTRLEINGLFETSDGKIVDYSKKLSGVLPTPEFLEGMSALGSMLKELGINPEAVSYEKFETALGKEKISAMTQEYRQKLKQTWSENNPKNASLKFGKIKIFGIYSNTNAFYEHMKRDTVNQTALNFNNFKKNRLTPEEIEKNKVLYQTILPWRKDFTNLDLADSIMLFEAVYHGSNVRNFMEKVAK